MPTLSHLLFKLKLNTLFSTVVTRTEYNIPHTVWRVQHNGNIISHDLGTIVLLRKPKNVLAVLTAEAADGLFNSVVFPNSMFLVTSITAKPSTTYLVSVHLSFFSLNAELYISLNEGIHLLNLSFLFLNWLDRSWCNHTSRIMFLNAIFCHLLAAISTIYILLTDLFLPAWSNNISISVKRADASDWLKEGTWV